MLKEEIIRYLFAVLAELQAGITNKELYNALCIKLSVLYHILGDDVPEEYWEQIEKFIY